MRHRRAYLAAMAVAACLLAAVRAQAQTPVPTPQHPIDTRSENPNATCSYSGTVTDGKASSTANCPPANPAQQFPFPGETAPNALALPNLQQPAAPQPQAGAPNPAHEFPYPGEAAAPATPAAATAAPGTPPPYPGDPAAGESSSSSSGSGSNDDNGLKDAGSSGANSSEPPPLARRDRHRLAKVDPQSPDEREAEDVSIAAYYQSIGNFLAAYDRAKDAVSLDDKDADAYVALGISARRLGKLDEAEKAFQRALTLDPVPKQKKEAERSLEEMRGGSSAH